jgi:transcriptional regulator with XRE-family HTH domain
MQRGKHEQDPRIREISDRILAALVKKGWTQEQLEIEARFGQGYLTRLLKGRQKRILPRTLQRIETALDLPSGALVAGLDITDELSFGGALGSRALQQIEGYPDAEFQVARLEPRIPFEVFLEARRTRLPTPPALITVDFLRAYVKFLAEHLFGDANVKRSDFRRSAPRHEAPAEEAERKSREVSGGKLGSG